ncbi:hypothetical protein B0H65DRAFT_468599 [Neurospora tetraspora]|uniref:Uncharacterized protein n=1 Tax=Neurospora tetraspora TaxID=94610 RepID=A0AAE0MQA2_9PEZI|nr:hypothetical protein B0H65DRAFT_468599 [Neurospora tetraspora]
MSRSSCFPFFFTCWFTCTTRSPSSGSSSRVTILIVSDQHSGPPEKSHHQLASRPFIAALLDITIPRWRSRLPMRHSSDRLDGFERYWQCWEHIKDGNKVYPMISPHPNHSAKRCSAASVRKRIFDRDISTTLDSPRYAEFESTVSFLVYSHLVQMQADEVLVRFVLGGPNSNKLYKPQLTTLCQDCTGA